MEDHLSHRSRRLARREPARRDPSREVPEHQRNGLLERQRRRAHEHEALDLDAVGERAVDGEHGAEGVPGQRERAGPRAATLDDPPTVGRDGCAARDERRRVEDRPAGGHRASVDPRVGSPTGDEEPAHGGNDTRHTSAMAAEVSQPARDLGSGVSMPVLGLGVWQMNEGAETEHAVEWALEAGYRHIDTAQFYRNERSVGAALARSGLPREEVFVTTKWLPVARPGRRSSRASSGSASPTSTCTSSTGRSVPDRARVARPRGAARPRARPRHRRHELRRDRLADCSTARPGRRRSTRCSSARSTTGASCSSSASSAASSSRPTARSSGAVRSTTQPSSRSPGTSSGLRLR